MNIPCPKCGSTATRLEVHDDRDVMLECRCGYCKPMATTLEGGILITHLVIEDGGVQLPRGGSKLMECLGALASLKEATTAQIAATLTSRGSWVYDEVASFLTILKHRGLVRVLAPGKGLQGGSTWGLTSEARGLLSL